MPLTSAPMHTSSLAGLVILAPAAAWHLCQHSAAWYVRPWLEGRSKRDAFSRRHLPESLERKQKRFCWPSTWKRRRGTVFLPTEFLMRGCVDMPFCFNEELGCHGKGLIGRAKQVKLLRRGRRLQAQTCQDVAGLCASTRVTQPLLDAGHVDVKNDNVRCASKTLVKYSGIQTQAFKGWAFEEMRRNRAPQTA